MHTYFNVSCLPPDVDGQVIERSVYKSPHPSDDICLGLIRKRKVFCSEKSERGIYGGLHPIQVKLLLEAKCLASSMTDEFVQVSLHVCQIDMLRSH